MDSASDVKRKTCWHCENKRWVVVSYGLDLCPYCRCSDCDGRGYSCSECNRSPLFCGCIGSSTTDCPTCHGTGTVIDEGE